MTGRAAEGAGVEHAGVDGTAAPIGEAVPTPAPSPTPAAAPAAPPPSRRSARTARRRHARTRTVVAATTTVLLVGAVALAGVQLHTSRQRAAEAAERAEAIGLAADVAAEDAEFLSAQDRLAQADAGSRALAREAAIQAERAAAEAARAAEEAAAAEAARVAQEEADAAARASASSGSAVTSSGSRIAGWVDGRPVDAAGNVLWVTSVPTSDGDGSNGRMPMSSMCLIPWGTDQLGFAQYLRCDAADALTALNQAFTARFGAAIDMDLTYRSYEDQVAMKAAFGGLAATPGTSSHGTGTALDVQEWATYAFGSERYTWLVENGPTYGWYAPARVREGQPYAEYWHFEYGPGRTS